MNVMTDREKLRECFYLHLEIAQLRQQINDLKEMATSIRSTTDYSSPAVKHSAPLNGPFENTIIKCISYEKKLNKRIDMLLKKQIDAEKIIDRIDNDLARIIFRYRYINGFEFKDIADRIHYSSSHVYYLHEKYLQLL